MPTPTWAAILTARRLSTCQEETLSRIYASCCVFASHRPLFVYMFVWLVVASSHCVSSSCLLAPPRHAALRRVVPSCLVSSHHHVLSRRCVSSCLIASSCVLLHCVVTHHASCSLCLVDCRVSDRPCIALLHCILSLRHVASCRVVSLPHFVYLIVTLLIPACRSPPLSHDVVVDALVAYLLPLHLPPRPNAAATFNGRPTFLLPNAVAMSSHLPTPPPRHLFDCCVLFKSRTYKQFFYVGMPTRHQHDPCRQHVGDIADTSGRHVGMSVGCGISKRRHVADITSLAAKCVASDLPKLPTWGSVTFF